MANQIQRSTPAALAAEAVEDLNRRGAAFIRNFNRQEPRMVEIAREFDRIAAKVREMFVGTEHLDMSGWVTTAVGLGITALGLIAALFTGGASMVVAAGAITAVVGGTVEITAKVGQFLREKDSAKDLERLGNEFMRIVRPLNEELKEIKAMMQQLQVEAAECYLMEKVRRVEDALRQVDDASGAIEEAIGFIKSLVQLIMKLLMRIYTKKNEDELTDKIIKSSEQCWKTINRFRDVKEDLQGFKTNIGAI